MRSTVSVPVAPAGRITFPLSPAPGVPLRVGSGRNVTCEAHTTPTSGFGSAAETTGGNGSDIIGGAAGNSSPGPGGCSLLTRGHGAGIMMKPAGRGGAGTVCGGSRSPVGGRAAYGLIGC